MQFDLGDTEYTDSLLLAWWFVPIDGLILAVVVIFIMSLLVFPLAITVYFLQYLALYVLLYLLGQMYEKTALAKRQTLGFVERLLEDPGQPDVA